MEFQSKRMLKRHKRDLHEWCAVCDLDFADDVALVEHRKEVTRDAELKGVYGKHVACMVCGEDFACKGGIALHRRTVSLSIASPLLLQFK